MKFRGRITTTLVILLLIIVARLYGYFYYGYPVNKFTSFAIIALFISWWLGWSYDKLKFLSEHDVLTKLHNRRYVEQMFPKILALMKRNNKQLTLFCIDVDHFKNINDTYGHKKGDSVLKYISDVIVKDTKKSEIAARWAGDEFLIVAPYTDVKEAKLKIIQVHNNLKILSDEIQIDISVSIGVAVYPSDGECFDTLFKVADSNMYKLKYSSREK